MPAIVRGENSAFKNTIKTLGKIAIENIPLVLKFQIVLREKTQGEGIGQQLPETSIRVLLLPGNPRAGNVSRRQTSLEANKKQPGGKPSPGFWPHTHVRVKVRD